MENNISYARNFLETNLPNPTTRRAVLTSLVDAIQAVHRIAPSCWGLNGRGSLQFTWKGFETPVIWWSNNWNNSEISFHLDFDDLQALTPEENSILSSVARLETEDKNWCKAIVRFPASDQAMQLIHRLLESYLEKRLHNRAGKVLVPRCQVTHRAYGADFIDHLRTYLQRPDIPQPKWYIEGTQQAFTLPVDTYTQIDSYLKAKGYFFSPFQIASFYTALQTKGFVILSGISGTGKTKLAQEFARLLPQPVVLNVIPDDIIRIKIQPYMRKYNRMIIPKAWVKLFNPPDPGNSVPVELEFNGQKGSCLLSHYHGNGADYIQLLLKEKVARWFLDNFPINSEIGLEMKFNTEGDLSGFKLAPPDQFALSATVDDDAIPQNHLFLSVRPDWRDSKSLLGYYNPLTETYQKTPFIEFLIKAKQSYEKQDGLAWFLILDEMNLARVEYYFADLLSVLESGRNDEGYTNEALRFDSGDLEEGSDELPNEMHLPPNLYIVGTVNVDETTQSFSPKVLDRAFSMEFVDVNLEQYQPGKIGQSLMPDDQQRKALLTAFTRNGDFAQIDKDVISQFTDLDKYKRELVALNASLQPTYHHFGYRIFDEIMMFLHNAKENGMFDADLQEAFDQAVLMKVLPKFHGSRGKLEKPLHALLRWCAGVDNDDADPVKRVLANPEHPLLEAEWRYPATAKRALRMVLSLNTTGFASFG